LIYHVVIIYRVSNIMSPSDDLNELEKKARVADPTGLLEKIATNAADVWLKGTYSQIDANDINFVDDTFNASEDNRPGSDDDFDDCVTVVTAIVTVTATAIASASAGTLGSIAGAALGAGGGLAVSRLVCRRLISQKDE
jgi:hypothetical protein